MGCKEREIEHFESLFYVLYPRLCALADHYLNDEEQSKDIVQEAFLNLWSMKETGKNIQSMKAYLYTSVRNSSLNYLRNYKNNTSFIMEILEKQDVIFKEVVIEEETIALLHASIERLPPQSSKIMKYVLQGRSNVEVAQEMGISVNTVKTLKYNAMKTLKEELKELYYVFVFILGERDLF